MDRNLAVRVAEGCIIDLDGRFARHVSPKVRTLAGSTAGGRWGLANTYRNANAPQTRPKRVGYLLPARISRAMTQPAKAPATSPMKTGRTKARMSEASMLERAWMQPVTTRCVCPACLSHCPGVVCRVSAR